MYAIRGDDPVGVHDPQPGGPRDFRQRLRERHIVEPQAHPPPQGCDAAGLHDHRRFARAHGREQEQRLPRLGAILREGRRGGETNEQREAQD